MNNIKIKKLQNKKSKSKLICLTAYSKSVSQILDKFCDVILVGDSLANTLYGMKNTHNIDVNTMIKHGISVRQGIKKSLLVIDMPKGSYRTLSIAKKNAKLILKKTKCDAVKIEHNKNNYNIIKGLVSSNINVMGHIGFTPQFKKKFKVEGKTLNQQSRLIKQALDIEKAGAFSIVLECIDTSLSNKITKILKIPTIGIGSSNNCDGQILVTDDLLGLSGFYPKFVKRYVNLNKIIKKAVSNFKKEVLLKKFPKIKNTY